MKHSVNLIPEKTALWLERRSRLRWWTRIWVASLIFLGMTSMMLRQSQRDSQARLELARSSVADVRTAMNQLQSCQKNVLQYSQAVEFSKGLEQKDVPLRLINAISECCRDTHGGVQLKSIKFTETSVEEKSPSAHKPRTSSTAGTSNPNRNTMQVTMNGVSQADRCTDFVVALRNSPEFSKVDLISSQAVSDQSGSLQAFQIRCEH